ncbi:hypothetical protein ABW20_dc0104110 [Dactylellina cionopaga]|nr:hypothetical protein ABW20_dc0104110 [Dactylellina cionopaga]
MQLAPGIPVSNIIQQPSAQNQLPQGLRSDGAEAGTSSVRSQSALGAQWDRVETPQSSAALLCPHITFHCVKPIDLKIRLTPTITVSPTGPLECDRMFATSIGERVNLTMSIEGNGKITRINSEPEGTKTSEKIKLLKKSQSKGAGGKWYVSRIETQLEGGWGSAEREREKLAKSEATARTTDPPPDRTVRFFIIIRTATREVVRREGLQVRGEVARVVYEVLGSKPPPIVPATKKRRGRGKAKAKGLHGDSNAATRDAERLAGPDPNPRVLVKGETGLTIFEYGGVLTASQVADEQMAEEAAAAGRSENTPE